MITNPPASPALGHELGPNGAASGFAEAWPDTARWRARDARSLIKNFLNSTFGSFVNFVVFLTYAQTPKSSDITGVMKRASYKTFLQTIILAVGLGVVLTLLFHGVFAATGSPQKDLERLFANVGVIKVADANRPVEIRLKDVFGNTVSLSDFRGKIVFLNFWATWCPTCVVEMPSMEKLHRRFKDQNFAVIAVNLQESKAQVKSFLEKYELSFTTLLDSKGEVASGFAVRALPTTLVLDKAGRIIGIALGPREWDHQASFALFEYLINSPSNPGETQAGS